MKTKRNKRITINPGLSTGGIPVNKLGLSPDLYLSVN